MKRRIEFEGSFNFRDLGGWRTNDGRTTKWGTLFRADAVHLLTEADARRAQEELGLRTLLDLRSDPEVSFAGVGLLAEAGLARHHLPLTGRDPTAVIDAAQAAISTTDRSPDAMVEQYKAILRASRTLLVDAVRAIARDDSLPAVFFCAAGKDRTGVLSATVLGALGVSDRDIVTDYELTGESIVKVIERFASTPNAPPLYKENPPEYFTPYAETMERVLGHVRMEYGSFASYLVDGGLPPDSLDFLQGRLLEPSRIGAP